MLTETDGLEKAIQIAQGVTCPPEPKPNMKRSRAFETGFDLCKHIVLQQLREEQNRRFKQHLVKESNSG